MRPVLRPVFSFADQFALLKPRGLVVPIWTAVEAWDFGTLSWLLKMAHANDRAAIAKRYGLLPNTLVSWIKTLAFVRNISAHHARLWNAGIINQPLVPKPFEAPQLVHIGSDLERRTRVCGAAAVASYFVVRINPGTSWPSRMKAHWQAFPAMPFGSPIQGDFLAGWDAEAIWARSKGFAARLCRSRLYRHISANRATVPASQP